MTLHAMAFSYIYNVENILGVQVYPLLHWGAFLNFNFKDFFLEGK